MTPHNQIKEALEECLAIVDGDTYKNVKNAIALLLAQEAAEPASKVVAYGYLYHYGGLTKFVYAKDKEKFDLVNTAWEVGKELYTTPQHLPANVVQQAQELSDDSISLMLDKAFNEEIARVSSIEYNSHEICSHFYSKLMKRFWAVRSLMGSKQ